MASRSSRQFWQIASVIIAVLVVIVALPSNLKSGWPSFLNPGFHLGLDLAGGTELDFRISEAEIQDQMKSIDQQISQMQAGGTGSGGQTLIELQNEKTVLQQQDQNIVEAIRTVLERRINSLGVSEATITPSYVGGEKHLLVDCPGVVDVQKCIDTVGKTIDLQFKEQSTEATPDFVKQVRQNVADAVAQITRSGATLAKLGQDIGSQLGMGYEDSHTYFKDELPKGLESVWNATPADGVIQHDGVITVQTTDAQGNPTTQSASGVFLVQVLQPRTMTGRVIQDAPTAFSLLAKQNQGVTQSLQTNVTLDKVPATVASALKSMKAGDLKVVPVSGSSAQIVFLRSLTPGKEVVDVSHILVAYKGANSAPANVTRTKAEALAKAQQLKQQLANGTDFATLARQQSDGPSAQNGGELGPISRGDIVPAFEDVAFSEPVGVVSDPVETPFGYHLIKVNKAPTMTADTATYDVLTVTGTDAQTKASQLLAQLQSGNVREQEEAIKLRSLFFSLQPTGWKDTPLDGKHFRTATVTLDPSTNLPVVQIVFDPQGGKLFQELTKNNIGKRIAIFVGGDLVSAPTVQGEITGGTAIITGSSSFAEAQQLAQDLNTGAIPAPIYLSGQQTVEATLGAQALHTSLLAGIVGMLIIMIYMLFVYRFLGLIADAALIIYALIFIDILKLPLFFFTNSYVVLTLAGAAGMILSIGMAVDCNVLVFERVKEELRRGKMLKTAVEVGFERAWPSIRDSNISTIITCALLFIIGTSIVRGFAITLGLGVIISMFTGMVIARWMSRKVANSSIASKTNLFPGARKDATPPAENPAQNA